MNFNPNSDSLRGVSGFFKSGGILAALLLVAVPTGHFALLKQAKLL